MCTQKYSYWHMVFAVFCLFVMLCVVGVTYFFLFFDTPYLSYKNLPFPTVVSSITPGEGMVTKVLRCNNSDTTKAYFTTRSLENIDKRVYWILPSAQMAIDPGCVAATNSTALPLEVPPGTYRLFGTSEVRGILRTHYVDWYSQAFVVLPKFVPTPSTSPTLVPAP